MKKLFYFCTALMLFVLGACTNDNGELDEPANSAPTIELDIESFVVNKNGTESAKVVKVTATNTDWEYTMPPADKEWCKVTRPNGNNTMLRITATPNTDNNQRSTNITITSTEDSEVRKTVKVTQMGAADGLLLEKDTYQLPRKASTFDVVFASNVAYTVELDPNKTWLQQVENTKSDEQTLTFSVTENTQQGERVATITIVSETDEKIYIYVKQRGVQTAADTSSLGEDIPVQPSSITSSASGSYGGTTPENLIDGDEDTYYSAAGNINEMPVSITCKFTNVPRIDYIDIVPGRVYGKWNEVDIYVTTKTESEKLYASYDFHESAGRITFNDGLLDPTAIRFCVKSANIWGPDANGHCPTLIAAHEFYFSAKNTQALELLEYFTDESYSELKEGVTEEQIDAIENEFFRNLAADIFMGDYDTKYRVATYKPYPHPDVDAKRFRTSTYTLHDNVTGMYFDAGEHVVFCEETYGIPVSLRVVDYQPDGAGNSNEDGHTYFLIKGMNKIDVKRRGLIYVCYHTEEPQAKPIKINFPTAHINKYYDLENEPDVDWGKMLQEAKADHIDMVGKQSIFTLPVEWIQYWCGTADKAKTVIQQADSIIFLQEQVQGHHKYQTGGHRNRMLYSSTMANAFMFAGAYRTGYSLRYGTAGKNPLYQDGTINMLLNPKKFRVDGWGAYHEVGHCNQLPGFKWTGMAEVTNNFTAMYCAHFFIGDNFPKHKSDYMLLMSGEWYDDQGVKHNCSNRYDAAWQCFNDNGKKHAFSGYVGGDPPGDAKPGIDPFFRIVPFWQLYLYNTLVLGNEDFYPDVYHQCRVGNLPDGSPNVVAAEVNVTYDSNTMTGGENGQTYKMSNDGERQMNFIRLCCDAAQLDLTEFFEQWGLMTPFYGVVSDYGNHVLRITKEMVDEVYNYAKKYPKPSHKNIWFINNYNLDKYRNGDGSDVTGFNIAPEIDECDGRYVGLYNGM